MVGPQPRRPSTKAFLRGLHELGYVYGEHFVTEARAVDERLEGYPALATELVRLQLDVIVAEAPDLPGCVTQAASFEEARENLVDAIEVWLMSGLRSGEDPPVVNGCRLAITTAPAERGGLP